MSTIATERTALVAISPAERALLLDALGTHVAAGHADIHTEFAVALARRLEDGDQYNNPLDEFVRLTLRKRDLVKPEEKRINKRLTELEEILLEEWAERGSGGERHEPTGKLVSPTQQVWARVAKAGDDVTPEERQRAADALEQVPELAPYVERGFNVQSLSAYFREQVNAWLDEQRTLPEHERQPLDLESFLPEALKGAIELTNKPTISVRG